MSTPVLVTPERVDLAKRAHILHAHGVGAKTIARHLGVPYSTIYRWLYPEYAEKQRVRSLEYKRRRRGVCERCGGLTKYGGGKVNGGMSRFCLRCGGEISAEYGRTKIGTGFRERQVLALLTQDGMKRYSEIRDELGITSNHMSVLLNRLLRHGLVRRVSRGRYALPEVE